MARKIVCLFPGQGIKIDYNDNIFKSTEGKEAISYINSILKYDIQTTNQSSTIDSQLSILLMSHLLHQRIVNLPNIQIVAVAGHSLGQFSAALAAGAVSFKDCVDLVYKRAQYMDECIKEQDLKGIKSIMVACIHENVETLLPNIVSSIDGAYIANYNSSKQIVVSGAFNRDDLILKCKNPQGEAVSIAPIKCIPLPVAGAFHSPFMASANTKMNYAVNSVQFNAPVCGYVCNKTRDIVNDGTSIKNDLIDQMISSVYWTRIMQHISELKFDDIVEVNTGAVLAKFTSMNVYNSIEYIDNNKERQKDIEMSEVYNKDVNDNGSCTSSEYRGKRVLITGGTGGIGSMIIKHLIKSMGVEVFFSTSASARSMAEAMMSEFPDHVKGFICIDLMKKDAPAVIMHHAMKAFAGEEQRVEYTDDYCKIHAARPEANTGSSHEHAPDILINCAGISKDALFIGVSDDHWHEHMQVNLNTAWGLSKLSLKHMLRKKWGRVIAIGSVIGKTGNPGQVAYATSKAAVDGMTKSLAVEVASRGITVNSILPGFIETSMTAYLKDKKEIMDGILSRIPMKRLGNPIDVAIAVEYLIKASYVTGTSLEVSGGMCRF
jgi:NAD(P)-dependent dehydrogenase (short-subunit alcohol dehydrogenase family)/malonyl CoA-acyl carrier protein transacylase